ncbi:PASTA domain-containing protein [Nocardiopsis sp. L17-MgMaSL7]|uniref:PASTA domain-containing protein n=1 Tax=Nocardiopsis sp. L17-MgMaSL7 TaxID=1938893 RepID=UPI000D71ADF3|nr:PASTA domain-containing protein [Nocardiopsis sp. L17-MgMaSL7]PWV47821.1 serine/threonine-protein kinase [Nocardiopsis sp. L17-MgMaSL7]
MESPTPSPLSGVTLHGRVLVGDRVSGDGPVSVHEGHDTVADQPVTVTLLDPHLVADTAVVHAFLGRAQTLAGLHAPGLVRVLGDGRDGEHVYLVTEPTPGETLAEVLSGGDQGLRYNPHMALSIVAEALEALRTAHDQGLVHGGPTPDDVVLGADGRVTVTGFRLVGAEDLTPRSDVRAVGALLHALLTGELRVEEGEPLRPSATVPGLPPDLDMLVSNATEPNPRYRPRDAGQYLNLVDQVLRSLPQPRDEGGDITQPIPIVVADALAAEADPGPAGNAETTPPWRRLPVLVGAGAVVLALCVAGWALVPGEDTPLPDLAGFSPEKAEVELAALELDLTFAYEDAYSEDVDPGEVAATEPAAGTELEGGESILLSLSVGPQHAEVPDVAGGTENDARALLREAGFTEVEVVQEHSAEEAPGTVLSSVPEVGEDGDREEPVTLHVSEGVIVPTLLGMGKVEASEALAGLGLTVSVVEAPSETVEEGAVSGQDPEPGTILPEDGAVTLTVSTGPEEVTEAPEDGTAGGSGDGGAGEGNGGGQESPASCSGTAWDGGTIYEEGDRVHYEGRTYEARWWIQGFPPDMGGEWGAWSDQGPC